MAKTIMIGDEAYAKLTILKKQENKSYTQTILGLIEARPSKTGEGLRKHIGILREDTEFERVMAEAKRGWKKWTEKYA